MTDKPEGYDGAAADEEGEGEAKEEEVDEEGNPVEKKPAPKVERNYVEEPVDPIDPITAVIRVRIPKIIPEPELDDEGQPLPLEYNEDDLDEIPFEDKCASINTVERTIPINVLPYIFFSAQTP